MNFKEVKESILILTLYANKPLYKKYFYKSLDYRGKHTLDKISPLSSRVTLGHLLCFGHLINKNRNNIPKVPGPVTPEQHSS